MQIALQSPSSSDRLAGGQILQNFLRIQKTLAAVVLFAFQSHAAFSAPYFSLLFLTHACIWLSQSCYFLMSISPNILHQQQIEFCKTSSNCDKNNISCHTGVKGIFCIRSKLYWRKRAKSLRFFCHK